MDDECATNVTEPGGALRLGVLNSAVTTLPKADRPAAERDAPAESRLRSVSRSRDWRTRRLLAGADVLAIGAGIGSWALLNTPHLTAHVVWGLLTLPFWILLFTVYGLHGAGLRRVGYATIDDIPPMAHALVIGGVSMWLYFQVTPAGKLPFSQLLAFADIAFVLGLTLRMLARKLSLRLFGPERVMFVGSGPVMPIVARQILRQPQHGLQARAVLTRPENERWPLPLPATGAMDDLDAVAVINEQGIDRVIVSAEGIEDDALLDLISRCRDLGVKITALPSLAAMMGPAATLDHLEGITLIGINTPSLTRSNRMLKRTMDVIGAAVLLVLTAPVWIVAAIVIKLDTPGPVLFRQTRIGRAGKPFRLAKFRSMVSDAEAQREALLVNSRQVEWLDLEDDPRITRAGRFLRLTSLDELPQLWNVLRGEMSLVGPRPLIAEEDQNLNGWARGRRELTPGITGIWQVMGRVHIPFDHMIMLDYMYVANWSLWTDVKLILQTVPVVLTRRGAN
jgi:exopolysaccharide biosynthesis polyprenyl glycosylphosphotransferase